VGGPTTVAPPAALLDGARSWLVVPLATRSGRLGMLLLAARQPDAYGAAEIEIGAALAVQSMVAYENACLFTQVRQLATVDGLTGLNNRRQFFDLATERLAGARAHGRPLAAIMLDIDHFKQINDDHGHQVGDEVLREVSARLRRHLRDTDILGRYGGEEFAIVVSDRDPAAVAERLRSCVAGASVETAAGPLWVTTSAGVSDLRADDTGLEDLLVRADAALYRAKQAGRNRVQLDGARG